MTKPSDAHARETVRTLLAEASTLTLGTTRPEGGVHVADLFFVADEEWNLYFVSSPDSLHCIALESDPRVAVTVHRPTWEWQQIAGIQMHGAARALEGAAAARAWKLYAAKYAFVVAFGQAIARSRWYQVTPHWARLIDNGIRFGYRREWDLDGGP